MITKRLRITAPEFRALPWHDQRMYLELLREEIEQEQEQSGQGRPSRFNAAGDLATSPFRVRRV